VEDSLALAANLATIALAVFVVAVLIVALSEFFRR
jgi:hypothetical protein